MEFLFDNPFILMILIGLISTLFGKKGEQQEQQKRPQQRRPSQQTRQEHQRSERKPAQQRPERRPAPPPPERKAERTAAASIPQLKDVQKVYEDRTREIMEPARHEPRTASGAPASAQAGNEEKPVTLDLNPDGKRLIEGIAWAQVLGPPRARDPHRTMRRR
ncbi:hypothetical protein [Bacillus sp. FJAT-27251]|uniref:hypothetical protein n=1 Tax=Bacillus sp. FJAT-27251 TaxID=1684142 RepID=UPI0006A7EEB0|nr:hypothetical protein [Bacillus sp. FJAT-27251]